MWKEAVWSAFLHVSASVIVAVLLFRLIWPSGAPQSPSSTGRKWSAYVVALVSIAVLPAFFRDFGVNEFALWILNVVVWGGMSFLLGATLSLAIVKAKSVPALPRRDVSSRANYAENHHSNDNLAAVDKQYERALDEIESGAQVRGLWSRAIANADGDEGKAKSIYIKLRVSQLQGSATSSASELDTSFVSSKISRPEQADNSNEKYAKASSVHNTQLKGDTANTVSDSNDCTINSMVDVSGQLDNGDDKNPNTSFVPNRHYDPHMVEVQDVNDTVEKIVVSVLVIGALIWLFVFCIWAV